MEKNIKKIEDMSLNAWPSHKMELYDGWILRFSYFYTHRTNSVEQFGNSTLPWREKVAYCEDVYKRLGSPAIFKISPLVSPDFDYTLENRGYEIQHVTEVMTLHLSDACLDAPYSAVTITDEIPDIWITSLFDLKGMTNPIHRAVVPSMYRAIPKETICASIWKEGKIIGVAAQQRHRGVCVRIEKARHKRQTRSIVRLVGDGVGGCGEVREAVAFNEDIRDVAVELDVAD